MLEGDPSSRGSIATSIVAGCFAIASALVPIIDGWRQRRDLSQKATKELDLATKQVAFWKSLLDASSTSEVGTQSIKSLVTANLLRVAAKQELELKSQLDAYASLPHRPTSSRLLLFYWPRSALAWIAQVFMYLTLAYILYDLAIDRLSAFTDPLVSGLFFAVVGVFFVLRAIAERLARPKRRF